MKSRFEVYQKSDKNGDEEYGWRFKKGNKILAVGRQYFSLHRIGAATASAKRIASKAVMLKGDYSKRVAVYECFMGKDRKWYWRVRSANRLIVAVGPKGYKSMDEAKKSVLLFCKEVKNVKD